MDHEKRGELASRSHGRTWCCPAPVSFFILFYFYIYREMYPTARGKESTCLCSLSLSYSLHSLLLLSSLPSPDLFLLPIFSRLLFLSYHLHTPYMCVCVCVCCIYSTNLNMHGSRYIAPDRERQWRGNSSFSLLGQLI